MRARALTQASFAFCMGIVGAEYQRLWLLVGITAALAFWWNRAYRKRTLFLCMASCLALSLLGGWRHQGVQRLFEAAEEGLQDGEAVTLIGTVSKKEEKNDQIIYQVESAWLSEQQGWRYVGSGIIYLEEDLFVIGDTLWIGGALKKFQPARNEGNFDQRGYYRGKGLCFAVRAKEAQLLRPPAGLRGLGHRLHAWLGRGKEALYQMRRRIRPVYERFLPPDQAGVLSLMALGDKGLLEAEVKELYQQAGISHVLAISGLHISIVGMGLFGLLRKVGLPYGISGVAAGILLICFGQLAGMELSTSRAVLMFLVMLLGGWLGMAYDSVTALSLSALLQLWECPASLWYAGFQFSYAAVLAVVVAFRIYRRLLPERPGGKKEDGPKRLREKISGWLGQLGETVFVSLCIQLVTLPLTLWHSYEFPLYSVLINGLLLPFMGWILFLGLVGGLSGLLWGMLPWLPLKLVSLLLSWNETVCRLFLKLPFAQVVTGKPDLWQMCAYYALLWGCLYFLWSWGKARRAEAQIRDVRILERSRGGGARGLEHDRGGGTRGLEHDRGGDTQGWERVLRRFPWLGSHGVGVALGMLPVISLCFMSLLPGKAEFRMDFLDVGQGDGIYIKSPQGGDFFVDGGSSDVSGVGKYRILSFLKYHGVAEIDGWFVSHGDNDHISGLLEAWEAGYPIRRLILAEGMARDEAWQELVDLAKKYGTETLYLSPGQKVGSGELTFTCLWPDPSEGTDDRNAASMAMVAECRGIRTLLNGDITSDQEQWLSEAYPQLRVDVYKAAHHGSKYSNSQEFLQQLSPQVSVVSCSEKNRYGHPGKEAVAHMEEAGSEVLYTMEGGQITVGERRGGIWARKLLGE